MTDTMTKKPSYRLYIDSIRSCARNRRDGTNLDRLACFSIQGKICLHRITRNAKREKNYVQLLCYLSRKGLLRRLRWNCETYRLSTSDEEESELWCYISWRMSKIIVQSNSITTEKMNEHCAKLGCLVVGQFREVSSTGTVDSNWVSITDNDELSVQFYKHGKYNEVIQSWVVYRTKLISVQQTGWDHNLCNCNETYHRPCAESICILYEQLRCFNCFLKWIGRIQWESEQRWGLSGLLRNMWLEVGQWFCE